MTQDELRVAIQASLLRPDRHTDEHNAYPVRVVREQDRLEDEAFDFLACQARVARQLAAAMDDARGPGDGLGL